MKRSSWIGAWVAALAISGCGAGESAPKDGKIGRVAPDVQISPLSPGSDVKISDYKGKVVLLDFWATWCAPCRATMPAISALQEKYGSSGLVVLGITNEDRATVMAAKSSMPEFAYDLFLDTKGAANGWYGVESLPTMVIIGRDGKIFHEEKGGNQEVVQRLESKIREALGSRS